MRARGPHLTACSGPRVRLLVRPLPRFRAVARAWTRCLVRVNRCFWRPSSFWLWLFAGFLAVLFLFIGLALCGEGRVFLIVLIRNLLFVPARGWHFILRVREQPQIECGLQEPNPPIRACAKVFESDSRFVQLSLHATWCQAQFWGKPRTLRIPRQSGWTLSENLDPSS